MYFLGCNNFTTFLTTTPVTLFLISSESKKSYLLIPSPSTLRVSKIDNTSFPIGLLSPSVS
jgi:hypothetical protein